LVIWYDYSFIKKFAAISLRHKDSDISAAGAGQPVKKSCHPFDNGQQLLQKKGGLR
jgi:hypothetical protein